MSFFKTHLNKTKRIVEQPQPDISKMNIYVTDNIKFVKQFTAYSIINNADRSWCFVNVIHCLRERDFVIVTADCDQYHCSLASTTNRNRCSQISHRWKPINPIVNYFAQNSWNNNWQWSFIDTRTVLILEKLCFSQGIVLNLKPASIKYCHIVNTLIPLILRVARISIEPSHDFHLLKNTNLAPL